MKRWLPQYSTRETGGSIVQSVDDWHSLQNTYAARRLIRYNYYNLVTGDRSVLKQTGNRNFSKLLIDYAIEEKDINLLPVVKSISADTGADESLRQRASEAVEILEEHIRSSGTRTRAGVFDPEADKNANARRLLAGIRSPHTTEILRLLRDKSPIQKRYAIYAIGKFRLTDMLPEVCAALTDPRLVPDACAVLHSFGSSAAGDLQRLYLATSGNLVTGRHILKLLGENCIEDNRAFLISLLGSSLRHVREIILQFLTECNFRAREEEKGHLLQLISDTGKIISWIVSLRSGLDTGNNNTLLVEELENEYLRWKDYLKKLTGVTLAEGELDSKANRGDEALLKEWIREVLSDPPDTGHEEAYYRKMYRRLKRYFPSKIPSYYKIHEDIINCDYNFLTLFTKTCAVRNIGEIEDDELADSLIALLFSPEEILREEAARVLARPEMKHTQKITGRIQTREREYIEQIISGRRDDMEFIFEKLLFLASVLPGINKDELLILASGMIYAAGNTGQLTFPPEGFIAWVFMKGNTEPEIIINTANADINHDTLTLTDKTEFCCILPLSAVEEFDYQFPESSFAIFKIIDDNEV